MAQPSRPSTAVINIHEVEAAKKKKNVLLDSEDDVAATQESVIVESQTDWNEDESPRKKVKHTGNK